MLLIQLLQTQPVFFAIAMALLGLIVGSFLNVVIYRLPKMMEWDWHEQCCDLLEIKNERDGAKVAAAE